MLTSGGGGGRRGWSWLSVAPLEETILNVSHFNPVGFGWQTDVSVGGFVWFHLGLNDP